MVDRFWDGLIKIHTKHISLQKCLYLYILYTLYKTHFYIKLCLHYPIHICLAGDTDLTVFYIQHSLVFSNPKVSSCPGSLFCSLLIPSFIIFSCYTVVTEDSSSITTKLLSWFTSTFSFLPYPKFLLVFCSCKNFYHCILF